MEAEFRTNFDSFMTMTDGNSEQAQKLAYDSMKKAWGVWKGEFMKYSPVSFYHVDGIDDEWISDQFDSEMKTLGHKGAVIGADHSTARSNEPSYPVMVNNKQGLLVTQ